MIRTRTRVGAARTSSDIRGEQLSIKSTASHASNSSESRNSFKYGTKIALMYSRKSLPLISGFDQCRNIKSTPRRTPRLIGLVQIASESCDVTIEGVRDSPAAMIHIMIDMCLTLLDAR
jgi:hypothetical protein